MSNPVLYLMWRMAPGALFPKGPTKALGLGAVRWVEVFNCIAFLTACGFLLRLNLHTKARLASHRQDVAAWRRQALPASQPGDDDGTNGGAASRRRVQGRVDAAAAVSEGRSSRAPSLGRSICYYLFLGDPPIAPV